MLFVLRVLFSVIAVFSWTYSQSVVYESMRPCYLLFQHQYTYPELAMIPQGLTGMVQRSSSRSTWQLKEFQLTCILMSNTHSVVTCLSLEIQFNLSVIQYINIEIKCVCFIQRFMHCLNKSGTELRSVRPLFVYFNKFSIIQSLKL